MVIHRKIILSKTILEPSCGDCAFLKEIVKRFIIFAKKENYTNEQIIKDNNIKESGKVCFITPNSFLRNQSSKTFREFIRKNHLLSNIVDFANHQVFDNVSTYTIICLLQHNSSIAKYYKYHHENISQKFSGIKYAKKYTQYSFEEDFSLSKMNLSSEYLIILPSKLILL